MPGEKRHELWVGMVSGKNVLNLHHAPAGSDGNTCTQKNHKNKNHNNGNTFVPLMNPSTCIAVKTVQSLP